MANRRRLREERRQQMMRARRRRLILIAIPVILVLAGLGYVIYVRLLQSIEGLQTYGPQERGHATNISIPESSLPPVGGVHNPVWLNCGIYNEPVEVTKAIHSLEHGAVWLAYQPDLLEEKVEIVELYAEGNGWILVSPFPNLEKPVVATAWGAQLPLDDVPDPDLERFITRYQGQGPEPGATCTGGEGDPR